MAIKTTVLIILRVYAIALNTIIAALIFTSCNYSNAGVSEQSGKAELQEEFRSNQLNGKWTTDRSTAMELRAMQSSIENFNLLIKKQVLNLDAYRGYGDLLQNHVDRTVTYCSLDKNTRSLLCKDLDKMRVQIELLKKKDLAHAKNAAAQVTTIFTEIDSTFSLNY